MTDTVGAGLGPATHGLWAATAPAQIACAPLIGDHVADVVVIGAGFTGCSAALHLATAGKDVRVLDAGEIGFGGAGRNVGLVNAGMWTMPEHAIATLGQARGEHLLDQLGSAPRLVFNIIQRYGIACEASPVGTLHCAVGRKGFAEIEERARQWRARGADVELLARDAAAARTGSPVFAGALLDRRAGTVQPLAYVRGLAEVAHAHGARFHAYSCVTDVSDQGAGLRIETNGGSVRAQSAIVATDAYSTGRWSQLRREQVMLPYFNLATEPLDAELLQTILPGGEGAWDTNAILSSFRRDQAGRLIFGSVGALRGAGTAVHRAWGERALARLFPQLGEVAFAHAWYGMIGMTSNALPRFHRLGRNIYSISGYNGRGIAPGTTFGRDLARLAIGEMSPDDLALPLTEPSDAPFRILRSAFYEIGAQAAHLATARL